MFPQDSDYDMEFVRTAFLSTHSRYPNICSTKALPNADPQPHLKNQKLWRYGLEIRDLLYKTSTIYLWKLREQSIATYAGLFYECDLYKYLQKHSW